MILACERDGIRDFLKLLDGGDLFREIEIQIDIFGFICLLGLSYLIRH